MGAPQGCSQKAPPQKPSQESPPKEAAFTDKAVGGRHRRHADFTVTPAHGKPSLNRVLYKLKEFVDSCFDKQGNYLLKEYNTNESKKTCRFCEFNQTEYCDKGIK